MRTAVTTRLPRRRFLSTPAQHPPLRPHPPSDALLRDVGAHWQALMTPEIGASLVRDGYCVVPKAFPSSFTKLLRDEMQYLHATKQLYANATHILLHGEPRATLLEKHHIMETELVLPEIRAQVPALQWLFESQQVFRAVQQNTPSWLQLHHYMIKLQYNEGSGGCFPMHFDSYGGGDDAKVITAVLYLNDAWQAGDGGEIVLYPFPKMQERVVVEPRDGDLVLFSSQQMLHRVLPATKPRYCLTTWMYHTSNNSKDKQSSQYQQQQRDFSSPEEYESHVLDKIMRSSFRRHLAKLYHQEEWAQSLVESHRYTKEFAKYMATHEKEVAVIDQATTQMLAKFQAKDPAGQASKVPGNAKELFTAMQENQQYRALLDELASGSIPWF